MKGGIFNRSECCNQPCECPVCLENKPLMRLNCNHYVCLEDIQYIISSNPRRLQKCPICRELINNYGCNGNIINVGNNQNQQPNVITHGEIISDGEETDDDGYVNRNINSNRNVVADNDGYETDEIYGGKRKTTRTQNHNKKIKLNNRKKTNRRYKNSKRKNKTRKNKNRN